MVASTLDNTRCAPIGNASAKKKGVVQTLAEELWYKSVVFCHATAMPG